jgi:hypothetical protein
MKEKIYRKLTGRGRSSRDFLSANTYQLAMGPDHLLQICSSRYTYSESYKRFYFKDIQMFVMHQNQRRLYLNLFAGILAAILFGIASLGASVWSWEIEVVIMFGVLGAVPLICLLINSLLGPTCNCWLSTAVHLEELPSIKRVRRARKIIEQIKPLLSETQGVLSTEVLQQTQVEFETKLKSKVEFPKIRDDKGTLHRIVFAMLIGNGVIEAIDLVFDVSKNDLFLGVWAVFGITMLVLLIVAVARQGKSNIPLNIRKVTTLALAYQITCLIVGIIFVIYLGIQFGMKDLPTRHPLFLGESVVSMMLSFGFGIAGLVLLRRLSNQRASSSVQS